MACQRDIRKSFITPKSFKLSAQNFDSSITIMYWSHIHVLCQTKITASCPGCTQESWAVFRRTHLPQEILVLDWSISKKSSSLKLFCQNEPKFGGKHLWKVLYSVSSKQNERWATQASSFFQIRFAHNSKRTHQKRQGELKIKF